MHDQTPESAPDQATSFVKRAVDIAWAQTNLLLPFGAAVTLIVLLWLWRAGTWVALGEITLTAPDTIAAFFTRPEAWRGVISDLGIGWGAVLIGRGVGLLLRPHSVIHRWPKWSLWYLPLVALMAAVFVVRAADFTYCYLGQCHFTAEGFLYADAAVAPVTLDTRGLILLAILGGTIATASIALIRDINSRVDVVHKALPRWFAVLLFAAPVAVGGFVLHLVITPAINAPPDAHDPAIIPEVNFAQQYQDFVGGPICAGDSPYCVSRHANAFAKVPAGRYERWKKAGFVPDHSSPEAPFPLLRFGLGEPDVPHPLRENAPDSPNVVLTLIESGSGHFLSTLSGQYEGLMNELDSLAKRMTTVHSFYNTASPTVNGLVATLCSIHPSRHPSDLGIGEEIDGQTPMTCLPDVLRARGYRTLFVMPTEKTVTGIEYFMLTHGFDEIHGRGEIRRTLPGRAENAWGVHDDTLAQYIQWQVLRLEKLREKDGRPFLVVYITGDAHEPGMHDPATCELPAKVTATGKAIADVPDDDASKKQLAAFFCTDRELGKTGRFLLDPKRADMTMWVITSDHALIRTPGARRILFKEGWQGAFAPIPLMIWDPRHDLPTKVKVVSGSTDVAPTMMHLLGGKMGPNSFTGRSIFGTRRDRQVITGRMGTRMLMLADKRDKREMGPGHARKRCKEGKPFFNEKGDFGLDACDIATYFEWQDTLHGNNRVLPARHFSGLSVEDVDELARRQKLNKAEQREASKRAAEARKRAMARRELMRKRHAEIRREAEERRRRALALPRPPTVMTAPTMEGLLKIPVLRRGKLTPVR